MRIIFWKSAFLCFWLITFEARELRRKTTHFSCLSQRDASTHNIHTDQRPVSEK